VIKDPAEYNAYVAAVDPAKDANARISGLEAFVAQYPNSVMKNQALEILMGAYQQANNMLRRRWRRPQAGDSGRVQRARAGAAGLL
jgi:hypothetical protein